jgi:hypothetical protein
VLDQFEAWFRLNEERLRVRGLLFDIIRPQVQTNNNSIRAECVTQTCVAAVYLWESGESDRFILDIATGETELAEHSELHSLEDLYAALEAFCQRLSG